MTGGVAFIDYDNDGWIDIYLVNGSTVDAERAGTNKAADRLYRNNGDGTFTDVTTSAGLGDRRWGMGVAIADVNNDGFDDIYVTNYGPNRLYLNNGDGTFRDASRESGADLPGWSSSAAFADYDGDGDLDLYVTNYLEFDFDNLPQDSSLCRYRGIPVQCGPRGLTPAADRLLENLGDGRFRDVSSASGIHGVPPAYGLGVIWADLDNDGDLDLYVANDSTPNYLFRNNGDKTFTEIGLLAGVALSADGRNRPAWVSMRVTTITTAISI
jgi:enediyne biosynthesis protein E4